MGCVQLLAVIALAGVVSGEPTRQNPKRVDATPMNAERRAAIRARAERWETELKTTRNESDRYILLTEILQQYAILEEMSTPRAKNLKEQWDQLVQKNPKLRSLRGRDHSGRRAMQQQKEDAGAAPGSGSFTPKDTRARLFWDGKRLVAVHQLKIQFFELPRNVRCQHYYANEWKDLKNDLATGGYQGLTSEYRFVGPHGAVDLAPKKVVSFRSRIYSILGCSEGGGECPFFAVATDKIHAGYSPNDSEEREALLGLSARGKKFYGASGQVDFEEFYGVFASDGKIVKRLDFNSSETKEFLYPLKAYSDGRAVFGLGRAVPRGGDPERLKFGNGREAWEVSNYGAVRKISAKAAREKYKGIPKSNWAE